MKYKLIGGPHIEDGRTYTKGEVVESQRDLANLYQGKFEVVGGHDASSRQVEADDDDEFDKERRASASDREEPDDGEGFRPTRHKSTLPTAKPHVQHKPRGR